MERWMKNRIENLEKMKQVYDVPISSKINDTGLIILLRDKLFVTQRDLLSAYHSDFEVNAVINFALRNETIEVSERNGIVGYKFKSRK